MALPPQTWYPNLRGEVGPNTENAIRIAYNSIQQHEQAFTLLKAQLTAATTATTTVTTAVAAMTNTTNTTSVTGGGVNYQTATSYIVQDSDLGMLILMQNAAAMTVTLNSAVVTTWFASIQNLGTGTLTLQPDLGGATINGNATLMVPVGGGYVVFFDGMNWWALTQEALLLQTNGTTNATQSKLNHVAGANVTIHDDGAGNLTWASSATASGPTMTNNANGTCADFGNGYVEMWGLSGAAATGGSRATVVVTFPVAFAGVPVVVCGPDANPDSYGGAVFSVYPISITATGFSAEFTAGTTIGGGGPTSISNVVHANWIAKYYP